MISDKYSDVVIKKYGTPSNWRWSKISRENIECGTLVTGKCKTIISGQLDSHIEIKTYFISDEELEEVSDV